jgi:hypothetical protein
MRYRVSNELEKASVSFFTTTGEKETFARQKHRIPAGGSISVEMTDEQAEKLGKWESVSVEPDTDPEPEETGDAEKTKAKARRPRSKRNG